MQTAAAFITGLSLLVAPAATSIPIGQTTIQLWTTVAALEAQEAAASSSQELACAALFSAQSVEVGQPVILAWGSTGAVTQTKDVLNEWPLDGASTMSFSSTGTWKYPFMFYSTNGATTNCSATITVTQ